MDASTIIEMCSEDTLKELSVLIKCEQQRRESLKLGLYKDNEECEVAPGDMSLDDISWQDVSTVGQLQDTVMILNDSGLDKLSGLVNGRLAM